METWPSSGIPQSVRDDYEMMPRSGLLDETEQRNSVRSRTYPELSAKFSMMITNDELTVFRSFYDDIVKQSGEFTVPWLSDLGLNNHIVQFTDNGPSWSRNDTDGLWLLILPVDIILRNGPTGYYLPEVL